MVFLPSLSPVASFKNGGLSKLIFANSLEWFAKCEKPFLLEAMSSKCQWCNLLCAVCRIGCFRVRTTIYGWRIYKTNVSVYRLRYAYSQQQNSIHVIMFVVHVSCFFHPGSEQRKSLRLRRHLFLFYTESTSVRRLCIIFLEKQ